MVLVGATFLFLSFAPSGKILKKVSGPLRRKWLIILSLMGFFLFGYLFFDIVLIYDLTFPVELVTAGVFLGGAVFVFLIIHISQSTIAERQKAEDEIKILNESLEKRVTERTQALKLSNEFNNTVMNSIAEPIAIIDVKTYRIIDANQAFLKETRLPREQVVGRTCYEATHNRTDPCSPPHDTCPLHETLSQGSQAVSDHVHWTSDGEKRYVEVQTSPLWDERGEITRVIHIQRDITKHKLAEEALKKRLFLEERLKRAEKMEVLGKLAGGVAHDLNNVLGVSMGYSELLREKVPEGSPLRSYVDQILSSTEKGAAIIQDLLTLTRRGVSVSKVIDLNGTVSTVFKSAEFKKLQDDHPSVTFKVVLEKELLNINGSPVHLEKTVMNLLSNAAEAISGSGEVIVRTENRYLDRPVQGYDAVKDGEYAVLTVSDNGGGIRPDDLNKIFEPFYTKKSMGRSGTGLGLSIVWGTVKDHDGYIDIRSSAEQGSAFTLYFPVTRERVAEDTAKIPIEQYMGHGESVLVVDDVAEQRQVATVILTRLGYRAAAVSSGEKAVEYLRNNQADILILDMIMDPGIDGLETYKRVRENNPKQKAIIVSGFSETERVQEAQALGAGAYVKKPYMMEQVGLSVRDELRR